MNLGCGDCPDADPNITFVSCHPRRGRGAVNGAGDPALPRPGMDDRKVMNGSLG